MKKQEIKITFFGFALTGLFVLASGCTEEAPLPPSSYPQYPLNGGLQTPIPSPTPTPTSTLDDDTSDDLVDDDSNDDSSDDSDDDSDDDTPPLGGSCATVDNDMNLAPVLSGGWFLKDNNEDGTDPGLYLRNGNIITLFSLDKRYVGRSDHKVTADYDVLGEDQYYVVRPVNDLKAVVGPNDLFWLKWLSREEYSLRIGSDDYLKFDDGGFSSAATRFTVVYFCNQIVLRSALTGQFIRVLNDETHMLKADSTKTGEYEKLWVTIY